VLTERAVAARNAPAACAAAGGAFAVPRSGYENESLQLVTKGAAAWLGYARTPEGWSPRDAR
jgi:DNA-binding transcriptional LysR family regulator